MSRVTVRTTATRHVLALCLTTACASVLALPPDGGLETLQNLVAGKAIGLGAETPPIARPGSDSNATAAELLKSPLSSESAVRIALLNNPGLQQRLGLAGRSLTDRVGGLHPDKLQARRDISTTSANARRAWIDAVAAAAVVRLRQELRDATHTGTELTRRMAQVGNVSALVLARERAALSDATVALAQAQQTAFAARERLNVILGLWGTQTQFVLPDDLPALPASPQTLPEVETLALQADARLATAHTQWQIKLAATGAPRDADGLWDAMGEAAAVRALAIQTRSDARLAYFNYLSSFDIARHLQSDAIPNRTLIADEMVLRYNGMLTSIFEVLADRQALTATRIAAVEAQQAFWLAETQLQAVMAGVGGANP